MKRLMKHDQKTNYLENTFASLLGAISFTNMVPTETGGPSSDKEGVATTVRDAMKNFISWAKSDGTSDAIPPISVNQYLKKCSNITMDKTMTITAECDGNSNDSTYTLFYPKCFGRSYSGMVIFKNNFSWTKYKDTSALECEPAR
jgi:hypothetical protein